MYTLDTVCFTVTVANGQIVSEDTTTTVRKEINTKDMIRFLRYGVDGITGSPDEVVQTGRRKQGVEGEVGRADYAPNAGETVYSKSAI